MIVELRDVEPTPVSEALPRLRTLLSPYTGVVHELRSMLAATDDARLVTVACELADGAELAGQELEALTGGTTDDLDVALASALGEAVERYAAGFVPPADVVLASADELGSQAVDPSRFALFSREQYAEPGFLPRPFTRSTPVRWVRGFALPDGEPAYLPVQLVYLAGLPVVQGEVLIGYPTSSGLACGATLEEAVVGGLLEAIERDAFMLTWNNRLSLPRLVAGEDAQLAEFHRRYLAPSGVDYRVVDLSVFHGIPTALALVQGGARDIVSLAVGAACAPDPRDASRKAVGEAFAVRAWARSLRLAQPDRIFDPGFADIRRFEDHVHFYALPEHAHYASFLGESRSVRTISDVPGLEGRGPTEWLRAIARRLDASGTRAYAADVTPPDIRQAGLRVAKVLAPELCSLDVPHGARFLGGRRLYEAAWKLGLRETPLIPDQVNPHPHPFP